MPKLEQHTSARGYRFYTLDGTKLPSVTTILGIVDKPALVPWANAQGREAVEEELAPRVGDTLTRPMLDHALEQAKARPWRAKKEAADFGSETHRIIEGLLVGTAPHIPSRQSQAIRNFQAWQNLNNITLELTEVSVYSVEHGYAGTFDAMGWIDGLPVVCDWKTSKGLYMETALQLAAYAHAFEELGGAPAHRAFGLRLGKAQPEFEAKEVFDMDAAFEAFLGAKALFVYKAGRYWED